MDCRRLETREAISSLDKCNMVWVVAEQDMGGMNFSQASCMLKGMTVKPFIDSIFSHLSESTMISIRFRG